MNSGITVGSVPHATEEASPTNSSDARCACGACREGYDARLDEAVCRRCAQLRCDGGQTKELPEHIVDATPDDVLEQGPLMAVYEYEKQHIQIEHEERDCRVCEGETIHRTETDDYRSRTASVCSTCGETTVAVTDGGSNLYTCETPGCKNWKEVVTPDGYVCHHCAGKLEQQYEEVGEKPVLLADGGWLDE
ncbi:hypothetical protein OB905_11685 [Halobacteria archaeon AArc-dxtr1]|nr:hypothetical protein [Halobacteria archaeon AArc-dxtr1]